MTIRNAKTHALLHKNTYVICVLYMSTLIIMCIIIKDDQVKLAQA